MKMSRQQAVDLWVIGGFLLIAACGSAEGDKLPDGWEAQHLVEAYWSPFKDCTQAVPPVLSVGLRSGVVHLLVQDLGGVSWPYEVYVHSVADSHDVLFETTNPGDPWACVLSNDVRVVLGAGSTSSTVRVYRRDLEEVEDDSPPELVGELTVENPLGDCQNLTPCDVDDVCEGIDGDEIQHMGCFEIPACEGTFCAWDNEACWLECQQEECTILESHPAQLSCS
jgi:hypothetical protein